MTHNREQLIARLAERDTQDATQQDLEACYYQQACDFYRSLSDQALVRLGESCDEPTHVTEEQ